MRKQGVIFEQALKPSPRPLDPPHDVVFPLAQVVAEAVCGDRLQSRQVQLCDPLLAAGQVAQQVGHHLGLREEQFVGMVVIRHQPCMHFAGRELQIEEFAFRYTYV